MDPIQETKLIPLILPAAVVDNNPFTSNVLDLMDIVGAGYVEICVMIGATDVAMAVLKVMESDTKDNDTTLGGSPTQVDAADTLPGTGADNSICVFGIDLRAPRKRYLQVQATAGNGTNGTFLVAWAIARPGRLSSDATVRGLLFAQYA